MTPSKDRKASWQNNYIRRNYDRLNILIPQGQKATVEKAAQEANESVNQFTNKALLNRLGLTEWPKEDESDT